jgi:hypothetical protein
VSQGNGVFGAHAQFVARVWAKQPDWGGAFGCHAWKDDENGKWFEEQTISQPQDVEGDWCTYFCPNLFVWKRTKESALPGRWLYQDLDEVSPSRCSIPPSVWWETSPGRYQALWLLQRALPASELEKLNKALNRSCGADKGTWNLTRMLRIPGTWNGKRGCKVSPAYIFTATKPEDLKLAA